MEAHKIRLQFASISLSLYNSMEYYSKWSCDFMHTSLQKEPGSLQHTPGYYEKQLETRSTALIRDSRVYTVSSKRRKNCFAAGTVSPKPGHGTVCSVLTSCTLKFCFSCSQPDLYTSRSVFTSLLYIPDGMGTGSVMSEGGHPVPAYSGHPVVGYVTVSLYRHAVHISKVLLYYYYYYCYLNC